MKISIAKIKNSSIEVSLFETELTQIKPLLTTESASLLTNNCNTLSFHNDDSFDTALNYLQYINSQENSYDFFYIQLPENKSNWWLKQAPGFIPVSFKDDDVDKDILSVDINNITNKKFLDDHHEKNSKSAQKFVCRLGNFYKLLNLIQMYLTMILVKVHLLNLILQLI